MVRNFNWPLSGFHSGYHGSIVRRSESIDLKRFNSQHCARSILANISGCFHELFCSISQVQKPEEAEQSGVCLPQQ